MAMPPDHPGDKVQQRDDAWMVPGQAAAQRRIVLNQNRVFPAFSSLEIMSVEAAKDYLDAPLDFLKEKLGLGPDSQDGRLFGVILAFAITCVEADRANRERP